MNSKPELVLPAGSMELLKAAVFNGADAVYLGAKRFSARATAANFEASELREAIAFCHSHGKKAYLAINTLIKDSEMGEAIDLAKQAYLADIDAAIVQDLGLIKALRGLLPDLPLHASTQMTCHNKQGAEFLASLGMKRIVLARELSLKEIKEIKETLRPLNITVECFIHGALCFSLSGQCLLSSFAFNKSGNRGRCLQPCRLNYSLHSADKKEHKKGFLLSMKDLTTIDNIPELIDAGIDAFKVEGRLKDSQYVGSVALVYRKAIDKCFGIGAGPLRDDIKRMRMAFSRDPTTGYMFWNSEMVSSDSPAPRGVPAATYIGKSSDLMKLKLLERIEVGDKLSALKVDSVSEITIKKILEKSRRPDGSALVKPDNMIELEKGQMLYLVSSERLKLQESPRLQKIAAKPDLRKVNEVEFSQKKKELFDFAITQASKKSAPGFAIFVDEGNIKELAVHLTGASRIICHTQSPKHIEYFKRILPGREIYFKTPNFQTSSELDEFEPVVQSSKIVCSNLGALDICIKNKSTFWVDRELNIFNSLAVGLMAELGAEMIVPSAECSLREIKAMPLKEMIMPMSFFYPLLMTSRAYSKSGELKGKEYMLTDRMGYKYKVTLDDKRILRLYNPLPVDMLPELGKLSDFALFGVDLRAVEKSDARKILENLQKLKNPENKNPGRIFKNFTRGHYERDVE